MGKIRETTLILGEGPTEFYYFKSLCDVCRGVTFSPDYPKHTCIKELKAEIEKGIASGFNHIYCVIDYIELIQDRYPCCPYQLHNIYD